MRAPNVDFIDYYDELGVSKTATKDEIQKSYRKLAREFHPDRNKDAGAEDKFKRVAEAYEVLGDEDNRKKYDQFGSSWKSAQSGGGSSPPGYEGFDFSNVAGGRGGRWTYSGGSSFSDFFEQFMKGNPGVDIFGTDIRSQGRKTAFVRGSNHNAHLNLTLEEAAEGGRREISFTDPRGGASRKLEVKIPKGVRDGQKIRLKGQGGKGHGGAPDGDMMLGVSIATHPRFRIDGVDLYTNLTIAPWTAALGGEAKLKTLNGTVALTIPAGAGGGQKIRLRGKGFPRPKGDAGDLYAEIRIAVPKELTPKERELFEELAEISTFDPREG